MLALTLPDAFTELGEEDRHALERIAREPEQARRLALEAALHPEVLVEMQLLQARSSAAYRERIASLGREDQEAIWEIAREPGLLHELASGHEKSSEELERISRRRPEALREPILRVGERHRDILAQLDAIAQEADQEFEWRIADLSADAREVFRQLLDHPELLTLLATQVRLTVALGDAYRWNPEGAAAQLAALSEEVAQRDAQEEAGWAEAMTRDAEAVADLEEAARVYAEENALDYRERTSSVVETIVHVTIHPYPYWFGYPLWYAHCGVHPWGYWYPVPIHFGFYYHPRHHEFVSFGLPSFQFVYWYTHEWIGYTRHRNVHRGHGRFYSYIERHPHMRRLHHRAKRHRVATREHGAWARPRPRAEERTTRTHSSFFERSLQPRHSSHRDQAVERSSSRPSKPRRSVRHHRGGEGATEALRGAGRREARAEAPVATPDRVRGEAARRQVERGLRPGERPKRPSSHAPRRKSGTLRRHRPQQPGTIDRRESSLSEAAAGVAHNLQARPMGVGKFIDKGDPSRLFGAPHRKGSAAKAGPSRRTSSKRAPAMTDSG